MQSQAHNVTLCFSGPSRASPVLLITLRSGGTHALPQLPHPRAASRAPPGAKMAAPVCCCGACCSSLPSAPPLAAVRLCWPKMVVQSDGRIQLYAVLLTSCKYRAHAK